MSEKQEGQIRQLVREYMGEELRHPSVQAARKKLIREHFAGESIFALRPALLVPCLGLALVGFLFIKFQLFTEPGSDIGQPATLMQAEEIQVAPRPDIQVGEAAIFVQVEPSVAVEQVSSEVGSTVVYQKNSNDISLTVIWVLTGGGR